MMFSYRYNLFVTSSDGCKGCVEGSQYKEGKGLNVKNGGSCQVKVSMASSDGGVGLIRRWRRYEQKEGDWRPDQRLGVGLIKKGIRAFNRCNRSCSRGI